MRSDWQLCDLASLCTYINRGASPAYVESGGILVVNQKCVRDQRLLMAPARRTDTARKPVSPDRLLRRWDILVNSTGAGTLGRVAQVDKLLEPATVDSHVTIVRPNEQVVDGRYLGYVLRALESHIESLAEGSTGQTELSRKHLSALRIPTGPIAEQKAVARILGALDDRIDLLRQTNTNLESIAQALFKSWFINFDPVRAKANGREPEGIDAATAALFPDELEESALGLIPKEWRVNTLADHVTAERGLSYKGAGLCEAGAGVPMHNLNSVLEGGDYKYAGIKHYRGDYKDRHVAIAGDVIVANTEQGHDHRLIGYPAIVPSRYAQAIYSHHIYRVRLRPGSPLTTHVLYYMLMAPAIREQVIGCANGSTVNMLKVAGLEIPKFVCPSPAVAQAFERLASPLRRQMEANVERSEVLAALRDTLLPRLISGKLRLPEAEAKIGEATA